MPILDDLWAAGDREAVLKRVLSLIHEAPVYFGGLEALRKPFLAEAVRAWDAADLVPRGKAARPFEAALLVALRDLYTVWASGLRVAAPEAGDDRLNVSAILEGLAPADAALLKLVHAGTRFVKPEEMKALATEADKTVREILQGLAKAEQARRAVNAERAKAMDKFALARATGAAADGLVAWAVPAREALSIAPGESDGALGWPPGAAGKRLAGVREGVIGKLLAGKKG